MDWNRFKRPELSTNEIRKNIQEENYWVNQLLENIKPGEEISRVQRDARAFQVDIYYGRFLWRLVQAERTESYMRKGEWNIYNLLLKCEEKGIHPTTGYIEFVNLIHPDEDWKMVKEKIGVVPIKTLYERLYFRTNK
jgi:hypothetical protein